MFSYRITTQALEGQYCCRVHCGYSIPGNGCTVRLCPATGYHLSPSFGIHALKINCFFGRGKQLQGLLDQHLHSIITAKRQEGQQGQGRKEKRLFVSDPGREVDQSNALFVVGRCTSAQNQTTSPLLNVQIFRCHLIPSSRVNTASCRRFAILPSMAVFYNFGCTYNGTEGVEITAFPIEGYHPVFQRFTKNITTKLDKELLTETYNSMTVPAEAGALNPFNHLRLQSALVKILQNYKDQRYRWRKSPGTAISKCHNNYTIPLLGWNMRE